MGCSPSAQSEPSDQCSRFQIGAVSFSVSMQNRAASNASARCGRRHDHRDRHVGERERPGPVQQPDPVDVRPAAPGLGRDLGEHPRAPRPRTPRSPSPTTPSRPSEWSRTTPRKLTTAPAAGVVAHDTAASTGSGASVQREPVGAVRGFSHGVIVGTDPRTAPSRRPSRRSRAIAGRRAAVLRGSTRRYTPRHGPRGGRGRGRERPAAASPRSALGSPIELVGRPATAAAHPARAESRLATSFAGPRRRASIGALAMVAGPRRRRPARASRRTPAAPSSRPGPDRARRRAPGSRRSRATSVVGILVTTPDRRPPGLGRVRPQRPGHHERARDRGRDRAHRRRSRRRRRRRARVVGQDPTTQLALVRVDGGVRAGEARGERRPPGRAVDPRPRRQRRLRAVGRDRRRRVGRRLGRRRDGRADRRDDHASTRRRRPRRRAARCSTGRVTSSGSSPARPVTRWAGSPRRSRPSATSPRSSRRQGRPRTVRSASARSDEDHPRGARVVVGRRRAAPRPRPGMRRRRRRREGRRRPRSRNVGRPRGRGPAPPARRPGAGHGHAQRRSPEADDRRARLRRDRPRAPSRRPPVSTG